jgi:hypothetical protein
MIRKEPEFESFSNLLAGIIMGATIIHEFIGPLVTRKTLTFAGEIHKNKKK